MSIDLTTMDKDELGQLQSDIMAELDRRYLESLSPELREKTVSAHNIRFGWIAPAGKDGDPWVPPNGAYNSYLVGDKRTHNGQLWVNTILGNPFEPGVSGWDIVSDKPAPWIQPSGADAGRYMVGSKVTHDGHLWESEIDNNVWVPGQFGWKNIDPTE